jgi:hypothetical protein
VNLPDWLQESADTIGAQQAAGQLTRQQAATLLRDRILERGDQTLIRGVLSEFAGKALDAWLRLHREQSATGRFVSQQVQSDLFPDLPVRLHIRPGVPKAVILFTAHDWDSARAMIRARTENAINGAKEDLDQFEAAYERVRPLLTAGDMTTAEVADQIRLSA